jgi:hypothetical protein
VAAGLTINQHPSGFNPQKDSVCVMNVSQLYFGTCTKLGTYPRAVDFCIPPVRAKDGTLTCPCASPLCEAVCTGRQGMRVTTKSTDAYARHFRATQSRLFVPRAVQQLRNLGARIVRWNGCGDLYSADYIRAISEIAIRTGLPMWLYSRVWWQRPDLWALAEELNDLKNVVVWCSWDRSMLPDTPPRGFRVAWLPKNDLDAPPQGTKVNLVWRQSWDRHPPLTQIGGHPVCPHEQGHKRCVACDTQFDCPLGRCPRCGGKGKSITCLDCGICWTKKRRNRVNGPPA